MDSSSNGPKCGTAGGEGAGGGEGDGDETDQRRGAGRGETNCGVGGERGTGGCVTGVGIDTVR